MSENLIIVIHPLEVWKGRENANRRLKSAILLGGRCMCVWDSVCVCVALSMTKGVEKSMEKCDLKEEKDGKGIEVRLVNPL